jgi:hypothetical protein
LSKVTEANEQVKSNRSIWETHVKEVQEAPEKNAKSNREKRER